MGTKCLIGLKNSTGSIRAINCNYDGYVAGVGVILATKYKTLDKVNELLKLGDLSTIGSSDGSLPKPYNDNKPNRQYKSIEDYKNNAIFDHGVDYLYYFEDGEWYVYGLAHEDEFIKINVIIGGQNG